jgi:hypothetical protein
VVLVGTGDGHSVGRRVGRIKIGRIAESGASVGSKVVGEIVTGTEGSLDGESVRGGEVGVCELGVWEVGLIVAAFSFAEGMDVCWSSATALLLGVELSTTSC